MKPLMLKFCGIHSYKTEQTIDFQTLIGQGIFGIFGTTGSGKSTIIDAITLALYNRAARFESESKAPFINDEMNHAYVFFEYEALDIETGQLVKIMVERRYEHKTRKNGEVWIDTNLRVTKTINGITEIGTANTIYKTIGMEYHDFTKFVILPQGKFSELLLLGGQTRRTELERIFGIERFGKELNTKVSAHKKELADQIKSCSEEINRLTSITSEELNNLKTEAKSTDLKIAELAKSENELMQDKNKYTMYSEVNRELNEYLLVKSDLEESFIENEDKKIKINIIEKTADLIPIKKIVVQSEQIIKNYDLKIKDMEMIESAIKVKIDEAKKAADLAADELDKNHAVMIRKSGEYETAKKHSKDLSDIEKDVNTLRKNYSEKKKNIDANIEHINKLLLKIDDIKNKSSEIDLQLVQLKVDADERKSLLDSINLNGTKKIEIEKRKTIYTQNKKQFDLLQDNNKRLIELKSRLGILDSTDINNKIEIETNFIHNAETMIQGFKEKNILSVFSDKLNENEPCPLCGSVTHPNKAEAVLDEIIEDIAYKKIESEKKLSEYKIQLDKMTSDRIKINNESEIISKNISQIVNDIINFEPEKELNELNLLFDEVDSVDKINSIKQTEINKKDEEYESFQKQITLNKEKLSRYTADHHLMQSDINIKMIELEGIRKDGEAKREQAEQILNEIIKVCEIDETDHKMAKALAIKKPSELFIEVNQKIEQLIFEDKKAKQMYQVLWEEHQELIVQINDFKSKKSEQMRINIENSTKLANEMNDRNINEEKLNIGSDFVEMYNIMKKEIAQYEQNLNKANDNIVRLKNSLSEIDDYSKITSVLEKITMMYDDVKRELKQTEENSVRLNIRIQTAERDIASANEIKKNLTSLNQKAILVSEIESLLRGNHFTEYIAAKQLRSITRDANTYLEQITMNRLHIKLDNVDFIVWSDESTVEAAGGNNNYSRRKRFPKSLSGGETFIVSLCLSLAFSMRLQRNRQSSISFFFVDEGFGSLDNDSLGKVMSFIEDLRDKGMHIGIISHLDELKSRIPVFLLAEKSTNEMTGESTSNISMDLM